MYVSTVPSIDCFFYYIYAFLRNLHSFPTRRSSDLTNLLKFMRASKNDWRIQPAEFYRFHDAEVKKLCRLDTPIRSEERFSRNAETDLVCSLLLEKKNE